MTQPKFKTELKLIPEANGKGCYQQQSVSTGRLIGHESSFRGALTWHPLRWGRCLARSSVRSSNWRKNPGHHRRMEPNSQPTSIWSSSKTAECGNSRCALRQQFRPPNRLEDRLGDAPQRSTLDCRLMTPGETYNQLRYENFPLPQTAWAMASYWVIITAFHILIEGSTG